MKTLHLEKNGIRGLAISESFTKESKHSVLAGVVMSNEFQIDGFVLGHATIKGDDITDEIIKMYEKFNRDDISYILLPGTILSLYNIVDIDKIHHILEIPVIAVNSQDSSGLDETIKNHFPENFEKKLSQYQSLGPRQPLELKNDKLFLRMKGCTLKECEILFKKIILQGMIPESLRISQLLAKTVFKTNSLQ